MLVLLSPNDMLCPDGDGVSAAVQGALMVCGNLMLLSRMADS